MRKYVTIAKTRMASMEDDPDGEDYLGRTVYEREPIPEPTGLLDKHGNELYAIEDARPIGYVWVREED